MRPWRIWLQPVLVLCVIAVASPCLAQGDDDAFSAPDRSVTLDTQSTAHLGIRTAAAEPAQYHAEVLGLGQVLGLEAIAQTDADLTVAESAARTTQAALGRARSLYGADTGISRQAVEAAEQQATADAAALSLAQRKSIAAWGRDAPWNDANRRRALVNKLASGEAVIVRATFSAGMNGDAPAKMRVERLNAPGGKEKDWTASEIWRAPADPTMPGRSFFLVIEKAQGLADGDRVRVYTPAGESKEGAIVPAGSVVIAEGKTWLYIEEKPNYFVRQAVDISQPSGGGYFLAHGVQPGEKVVTSGAGHLLAKETGTED